MKTLAVFRIWVTIVTADRCGIQWLKEQQRCQLHVRGGEQRAAAASQQLADASLGEEALREIPLTAWLRQFVLPESAKQDGSENWGRHLPPSW